MRANSATEISRTRAKARDKSTTRLSILEAARVLVARHGAEDVTLAAVAAEAGFARPTVYGYFKNKDELLQALAAEDLSAMAGAMSGEWVKPSEAANPSEGDVSETPSAEEEHGAVPDVELPAPEQPSLPTNIEPVAEEPPRVGDDAQLRNEQKRELDHILSKLAPNDPSGSEGSAAALARFDRRLRVVERAVGELQGHQERADRSTSTSADFISESLRGLNQRLEEAERRQREAIAELRADAREAARRLGTLENGHPGQIFEPHEEVQAPLADHEPVPVSAVVEESGLKGGEGDEASEQPQAETEDEQGHVNYLAAARNSARIAAQTTQTPKPKTWLYRIPRKYLMFTCAAMSAVVMIIGVLVVQRASALAARADTISPAMAERAARHPAARTRQMAVATPLDELSAMATAGNGKAQLIVGLKYLKGSDGVEKNPSEAARWIGRAAQRGEPMAQYWAGYIYQHGIGVSADPDEALRWYEAAADQGNTRSMYNLGVGYAQGWTGVKDAPEASRWFARAARLGFVDAQFNLAVLYERGLGVPPNLSDAYKWYAVAAKNGDEESKKRLDALATQLSADDLAAAQRSATMFKPTPIVQDANSLPPLDLKRT